ncbi:MAG TPA: hypothetical protein VM238_13235 [Phycisphaerae bacterium]|nr:hypothetical protein [Phycisphaerae bacterium]
MKRQAVRLILGCIAMAACCTVALALGASHPNDQTCSNKEWPAGLSDIVNTKARVCGFFVNANDWFYFKGDTKAFNGVLAAYGKLKDTPLLLVLHPGRGTAREPWDKDKSVPCEWSLTIQRRGWGAPEPKPGETGKYVVALHLWLGGDVALEELDVPLNVEVQSGAEIERFVAEHQAKQSLIQEDAPSPKGAGKKPSPAPSAK